jgi:hypothetical protein
MPSDRCMSAKLMPTFVDRGCHMALRPYSQFLDWSHYFFFQVAPLLYSGGWVDPDLWMCSQELWPLDHRGSQGKHRWDFKTNIGYEGVGWIQLTQVLVQWWTHVNMVITLWVSWGGGGGTFSWATAVIQLWLHHRTDILCHRIMEKSSSDVLDVNWWPQ